MGKNLLRNLSRWLASSLAIFFVLPASTNYQLRDYEFTSGGLSNIQSANFASLTLAGEPGNFKLVGTNYQTGTGLIFANQANIPPAPTLTSDNYYNKLKLIIDPGNNPTDAQYAIAISPDGFSTTNYVQSDNTVSGTLGAEDWQTYTERGGASGFFIIGLDTNTTYTVKVKARQGDFTETDWGPTASAATTNVSLTFSISGVSSGTNVEGVTTDVTATATAIPFGALAFNSRLEGAQTITVSTNANGGYTAQVRQIAGLINENNNSFPTVSGTNSNPSAWPGTVYTGAYGYHTADDSLGTGTQNRFSADNTFAQFDTTAREIAYSAAAVINEQTSIVVAIEAGQAQSPGDYSHTIIYTIYGRF